MWSWVNTGINSLTFYTDEVFKSAAQQFCDGSSQEFVRSETLIYTSLACNIPHR